MNAAIAIENYVREDKRGADEGDARVLDLVHLSRQTDGDAELERELLVMFDAQAAKLRQRLGLADVSAQGKADIAHRLRGSALAVGARSVATAAEATERHFAAIAAGEASAADPLPDLTAHIAEVRAVIARLVG